MESDFLGRSFWSFLFLDGSAGSAGQTEIRAENEGDRGTLMGNPSPGGRSGRKEILDGTLGKERGDSWPFKGR